jgi:H+/gluconate symporter-like permease
MVSAISIIGFILGIAVLIFMIIKGFNMIIASVTACVILLITSGLDFWDGLLNIYAGGAGGFYTSWFFLMLLGGLFGHLCTTTGMATKIANVFTSVLRGNLMILGIFATIFILTMLGVNGFLMCFVMFPILNAMFKEKGMDRQVIPMILVSNSIANSFAFSMDPVNILISTMLGTGLGAAPALAVVFTGVHLSLTILYFNFHQKRIMARRSREDILSEYESVTKNTTNIPDSELPSFFTSILPFIICFTFVVALAPMGTAISIVASLSLGNALIVLFQFKRLREKLREHFTTGAVSG